MWRIPFWALARSLKKPVHTCGDALSTVQYGLAPALPSGNFLCRCTYAPDPQGRCPTCSVVFPCMLACLHAVPPMAAAGSSLQHNHLPCDLLGQASRLMVWNQSFQSRQAITSSRGDVEDAASRQRLLICMACASHLLSLGRARAMEPIHPGQVPCDITSRPRFCFPGYPTVLVKPMQDTHTLSSSVVVGELELFGTWLFHVTVHVTVARICQNLLRHYLGWSSACGRQQALNCCSLGALKQLAY